MTKPMIGQRTAIDETRYQTLKKQAATDVLTFREAARRAAEQFTRTMRQSVNAADSRNAPIYALFTDWENELAPQFEALYKNAQTKTLQHTIARQLNVSETIAHERAQRLVNEQHKELLEHFIDLYQYGATGRSYRAAQKLFSQPVDIVTNIQSRFVDFLLYQTVADELGLAITDPHTSSFRRRRLARKERRQVKHYKKQRLQRLNDIRAQQYIITTDQHGMIGKITTLHLDTVLALDAYRQYKKRIDALKPTSRTSARIVSIFTATTKTIRESYIKTLPDMNTLAEIQSALEAVNEVLVEIFDMTDTERNALMMRLKQYRELEREAVKISTEQATYV